MGECQKCGRAHGRQGNCRGGRSVASNGYVLIKVGNDHPLADVRGYAYEHRVVASEKIGRVLLPTEHVHHKDGNKQNNAPENLDVMLWVDHAVHHRKPNSKRRLPSEPNPEVTCGCGCGTRLLLYNKYGRPRAFLPGHQFRIMGRNTWVEWSHLVESAIRRQSIRLDAEDGAARPRHRSDFRAHRNRVLDEVHLAGGELDPVYRGKVDVLLPRRDAGRTKLWRAFRTHRLFR